MENQTFEDVSLKCMCGVDFIWTAGEQNFLQRLIDEGKTNSDGSAISFTQPKRCAPCRKKKKEQRKKRGLED